jgi:outer membrane receptor protein involved in Fe transport
MNILRLKAFCACLGITFAAVCAGAWQPAAAQEGGQRSSAPSFGLGIETIYSTARQRQEQFKDIPVAGTVLSQEALDRYSITDLEKIGMATPQVTIGNGSSGGGPTLYIRGVGSNSGSAGFDPAVGLVIDGVFYSRSRFVTQGFFDMEAVEILKGPQALYYGKNNSAGLIAIRTANPGDEFEAHARVGYEIEAREIIAEAVVSAPLSDKFGVRLAARWSNMDGWLKNVAGPLSGVDPLGFDLPGASRKWQPNEEEFLGRLTLEWTPNDAFDAVLKVNGSRNTDSNRLIGAQMIACRGPNNTPQPVLGIIDPFDDCKQNFVYSVSDYPAALVAPEPEEFGDGTLFSKYKAVSSSLQMSYDFTDLTLSSVSGFIYYDTEYFSNADISAAAQIPFYENNSYEAFSQELRLVSTFDGPLNFLAGFLYQDSDLKVRNSSRVAPLPPDPGTGRYFTWDKSSETNGRTWSVYGELVWDVTPDLEVAAGARYTEEQKDFLFTPHFIHQTFIDIGAFDYRSISGKFNDDNLSPQVTLTWRPTDDWTIYGAYKEGFKSGGFDNSHIPGVGFADEDLRFESEVAKGFELGAKASLLGGTLRVNAVAYRYTFSNLQVQQLNPVTTLFFIDNAAKSRTTGVEFDFNWLVNERLALRGAAAYNDGKYVEFTPGCYAGQTVEAGCNLAVNDATGLPTQQDLAGAPLVNAPRWNFNLGFTYEMPIGNAFTGVLTVDGRYSSKYSLDESSAPDAFQKAYAIIDASFRLLDNDDHWEVAVIGRNLTNEAIASGGFERALTGQGTGLPASAGASIPSDYVGVIQRGRELIFQVTYRY